MALPRVIDRVSVEPSRRCSKGCSFCYNGSDFSGDGAWSARDLIGFATTCAEGGVGAISFGGGEPLEYAPIFEVLTALDGVLFRSLTTNGLPFEDATMLERLIAARPDKVHVSIHAPENLREVRRVVESVLAIAARGIPSGINLLVRRSRLEEAASAACLIRHAGISNARVVFLPMRGSDTPTAAEVARVARDPFQSMTCLGGCAKSPRFASIDADRRVAWCSYTRSRRSLATPSFTSLVEALERLELEPCDGPGLVRLERGSVRRSTAKA